MHMFLLRSRLRRTSGIGRLIGRLAPMPTRDRTYSEIAAEEIRLQTSYVSDCEPQLRVLENAMLLLGDLMSSVEPPAGSLNPGEVGLPHPDSRPERFILFTQMMIGARAL